MSAANPKSIFEELAPYANMVVTDNVTVGKLAYASDMDLFSQAVFTPVAQLIAANTSLPLLFGAQGEIAQGWTTAMTRAQTNSQYSKGQPPRNQVHIITHVGFTAFAVSSTDASQTAAGVANGVEYDMFGVNDLYALMSNFSWDLTVGRGMKRTIGRLLEYPDLGGAWACQMEGHQFTSGATGSPNAATLTANGAHNGMPGESLIKLPTPIIIPPLINLEISAVCGNAFTLLTSIAATMHVVIHMSTRGYQMTMPVGS